MFLFRVLPQTWLEQRAEYAFFLGWTYSIISIVIAALIFPRDPSLVAIAFTSIMLLPELRKIFELKEEVMSEERGFSFQKLFHQNKDFVKVYLFLSLGIFLVYSTAAIVLPSFQVNRLFQTQLAVRGIYGGAIFFSSEIFWSIFLNNWWVLLACFLISLFTGDGGIFMITWNLSVWGTIFGVLARNASVVMGPNPFLLLLIIIMIVGPHGFLEILAYILGAISGGVILKGLKKEGIGSRKFRVLLHYNVVLFAVAVGILTLGALLETFVLGNSGLYREIIAMSYG